MENPKQITGQPKDIELTASDQEINYWSNEFGIATEELLSMFNHGLTITAAVQSYVMNMKLV